MAGDQPHAILGQERRLVDLNPIDWRRGRQALQLDDQLFEQSRKLGRDEDMVELSGLASRGHGD